ncbi:MAG: UbiA family prenyltransferase, partial [Planctomycetales bacterium]|nr:UbiA family prenyltransferase [Planctomycetales bacterium]
MFRTFATFLSMIRFSHTLFALPFALLAAVMAWRAEPSVALRWQDFMGIVLAMVTARSAAMAFNRLADYRIDADNPRTAGRHLPQGALSFRSVAMFAAV